MLAVVVSRDDYASEHVGEHLLDLADWRTETDAEGADADGGGTVYRTEGAELREFDDLHLDLDGVADAFGTVDDPGEDWGRPDLLVFASRHSGDTGALLTAHHTGNFGPAEYGGESGSVARACPRAHRRVVAALREYAPPNYDVGMECTHHGPSTVGAPSMFVELGSGDEQWGDPDGARAVARAILDLRGVDPDAVPETGDGQAGDEQPPRRHLVGFGGNHYAPRFERLLRETDWAVGHVAADWALDAMGAPDENRDVLRPVFEQSRARYAVVDGDRPALEATIADLGYRVVSETWVREADGVPLGLVDRLEADLASIDDGLRFGDGATEVGGGRVGERGDGYEVVDLPTDLLDEAQGIDDAATREAIEAATIAFETAQSGTRIEGRAAIRHAADRDELVDDLADVLRAKYDAVERTGGDVVARESAFDPERARTLGVPEGPKFGRLSAGEHVEVDGRTIDPAAVHVDRERRFSLD